MQTAIVTNKKQIEEFFSPAQVDISEINHLYVAVNHEDKVAHFAVFFKYPKYYISKTALDIESSSEFKQYMDFTMGAESEIHNLVYPEEMESEKEDSYELVLEFMKKYNLLYKKIERWESGGNYIGENLSDYYVILSRHRDSGIMDNSNWDAALKRLDEKDILIASFNHWAVGWVESILIKEDNYLALEKADEMMDRDVPYIDEADFYNRLSERAGEIEVEIKQDLFNKFQGNELTYPEKVEYAKRMWNLDLIGHDKIHDVADAWAGDES